MLLCPLVLLLPATLAVAAPEDAAWKARVERSIDAVEAGLDSLDGGKAEPGEIAERVAALHARLLALEEPLGIAVGSISGKLDLASLTLDVVSLQTRAGAIVAERKRRADPFAGTSASPAGDAPRTADDRAPDVPARAPTGGGPSPAATGRTASPAGRPGAGVPAAAPKREGERQWPTRVAFMATAKMSYVRKGARMKVEVAPDIFEDRFRMSGYEGRISFTLRAANLLRDVKSVTVRVGARMRAPVNEVSEAVRTIDVTWTADKAIGNDSLNSWVNYDSFAYAVTPRWYDGRLDGVVYLTADAYVTSVTLLDDTQLQFDVPDFNDQQKK